MTDIDALRKRVEDSGLKQKFIYDKLGISKNAWRYKRNGERPFTVEEIQKLCEILNITSLREKNDIFFAKM